MTYRGNDVRSTNRTVFGSRIFQILVSDVKQKLPSFRNALKASLAAKIDENLCMIEKWRP